jgi:membrane glycosyltransferase
MDALTHTHDDQDGLHANLKSSHVEARYATPAESRLHMPAQSLTTFDESKRRQAKTNDDGKAFYARLFVFGGALALTAFGAYEMYGVVNVGPITPLKWALLILFVVNFSWIALAFTNAIIGFVSLIASRRPRAEIAPLREDIAVVMPIYNESPSRVFAAVQAMRQKDLDDHAAVKGDNQLQTFVQMTPAQVDAWINANVNSLADAKTALKMLAKIVLVTARRSMR